MREDVVDLAAHEPAPARVLLADAHPAVRLGVREILESDGFEVCAETGDAVTAVDAAARLRPDLCLLSIRMPGGGIGAAQAIRHDSPGTAVVMLTASDADEHLLSALQSGASGYLPKGIDPEHLIAALRGALRGEAALPRRLAGRLAQEFRGRGRRRVTLTGQRRTVECGEREWEVLQMVREGMSTAAMAERLVLSPITVRRHLSGLLQRLGVHDREAALDLLEQAPDQSPSSSSQILIAGRHPGARERVRAALEAHPDLEVCAEARDGPRAVAAAVAAEPHACLLDMDMPGGGVTAAGEIVKRVPATTAIMLADSSADLFAALSAGATGYLPRHMDADRIGPALKGALAGEAAVPRQLVARMIEEFRRRGARRIALANGHTAVLTDREWEMAGHVRQGLTTADIAARMRLSPATVRSRICRLKAKLRVSSRAALGQRLDDCQTDCAPDANTCMADLSAPRVQRRAEVSEHRHRYL